MNRKRALFVLFLVVATELIGFGLIIPILPQIGYRFSLDRWQLGVLLAAYSAAQLIASPILGSLSDRWGRKPMLVVSKLGTVLSYGIFAYAGSYEWLLASRLLDGFTGGNISVARAYIVDITDEKSRSKGMAILGISFGLGFIIGPCLGGFLYDGTHQLAGLVAGAVSLLALILTIVLLKEPERQKTDTTRDIKWYQFLRVMKCPVIVFILGVHFVRMVVFSGFETTFALFTFHAFGFDESQNSWLFFYLGLAGLVIQGGLSRRSVSRVVPMVCLGLCLTSIAYGGLSMVATVPMLFAILLIFELGLALTMIYIPTWLADKNTDSESVGGVMGLYEATGSLARIIGPLMAFGLFFSSIRLGYAVFAWVLVPFWLVLVIPRFRQWVSPTSV